MLMLVCAHIYGRSAQDTAYEAHSAHTGSTNQCVCCLFLLPLLLSSPKSPLLLPRPLLLLSPVDVSVQLVIRWREAECDSVIIHADVCR